LCRKAKSAALGCGLLLVLDTESALHGLLAAESFSRGERFNPPKESDEMHVVLEKNEQAAELLRFAVSDDYFALRRLLGVGLR
jgi:hypothetical protein